jgi:hypothetical protein
LRSQFDRAAFKEGESVEDFTLRLNGMVATLATLGEIVEEHVVVEKIFRCVPPRLKQIVLVISTLLDVRTLTIANLAGWLKTTEEAFEDPPSLLQHEGKLYLTEEEWDTRCARHESDNQGSGSSGAGGGRSGGRGDRGRGRGRERSCGTGSGGRGPQKTDKCRRCEKLGHMARECRSKAKKDQAHVVQDEEASLMVLTATVNHSPVEGALVAVTEGEKGTAVMLWEEKVFVQLGKLEAHRDTSVWIVDTGATNHMTGSRTAFIDLDTRVRGTVQFGDDSVVEIEGRGMVEFVYKNGELRRFDGVYFIPKLTTNIVSVGRLDEDGYRVLIGGDELAIREPRGKLLARVKQAGSRLYLLHVTLSAAVC